MILVTGGEGFIGRHVCSLFSKYGPDVIPSAWMLERELAEHHADGVRADDAVVLV